MIFSLISGNGDTLRFRRCWSTCCRQCPGVKGRAVRVFHSIFDPFHRNIRHFAHDLLDDGVVPGPTSGTRCTFTTPSDSIVIAADFSNSRLVAQTASPRPVFLALGFFHPAVSGSAFSRVFLTTVRKRILPERRCFAVVDEFFIRNATGSVPSSRAMYPCAIQAKVVCRLPGVRVCVQGTWLV